MTLCTPPTSITRSVNRLSFRNPAQSHLRPYMESPKATLGAPLQYTPNIIETAARTLLVARRKFRDGSMHDQCNRLREVWTPLPFGPVGRHVMLLNLTQWHLNCRSRFFGRCLIGDKGRGKNKFSWCLFQQRLRIHARLSKTRGVLYK